MPKFSISNFHIGVRARGVAAGQILPAWRRSAAACIPGLCRLSIAVILLLLLRNYFVLEKTPDQVDIYVVRRFHLF